MQRFFILKYRIFVEVYTFDTMLYVPDVYAKPSDDSPRNGSTKISHLISPPTAFNRLSTLSAQNSICPTSPPQAQQVVASNSAPPSPAPTIPPQKESTPHQANLPLVLPSPPRVIPKAAINPITLTCKCPGKTLVANATAHGNIGPIKNPINAAETALTGTLGTNQNTNWMQRAMKV